MDSVKTAVGLGGKKGESGEEPVSGEKGEGTTAHPFDAGNGDEAQDTAQAQPEKQPSSDTPQKDSSSGGGGFLKSINPFSKKQEGEDTNTKTTAAAEKQPSTTKAEVDDSKRPPNHLGVNVPEGHSLDFAPPQPPDQSPSEAKKMADNQPNQTVANTSAEGTDSGFGKAGQLNPDWQSRSASGAAKTQQLRGSRASMSAASGQRVFNPAGTNPGRIPTAGGQMVGARASEDRRRKSMWGSTDEGKMPELDKQGSPDPVTQENTAANTAPLNTNGEGSSKMADEPKPDFNTFAWGEGGEGAAAATTGDAEEKKEETSTAAANGNKSTAAEKAEEVKEKVKDAVPTSTGASTEQKKERRASRFDAFKSKLMGKS